MGVEASKPVPDAQFRVIGAGLPRTGTASFAAALSILLNGPVYHGGTQLFVSNDETHVKRMTEVLKRTPYKSPADRIFVMSELRDITKGYVAALDAPFGQFVPELMEIYPDAKVICTIRDADAWAKSMDATAQTSLQSMLSVLVFWVPCLRYFTKYITALNAGRWGELYAKPGEKWSHGRDVWDRHVRYLESTVPPGKLVWYDVRDGWEPLCKELKVGIAEGIEFPRVNDGKAIEEFAKAQVRKGMIRWMVVTACVAVAIYTVLRLY